MRILNKRCNQLNVSLNEPVPLIDYPPFFSTSSSKLTAVLTLLCLFHNFDLIEINTVFDTKSIAPFQKASPINTTVNGQLYKIVICSPLVKCASTIILMS